MIYNIIEYNIIELDYNRIGTFYNRIGKKKNILISVNLSYGFRGV